MESEENIAFKQIGEYVLTDKDVLRSKRIETYGKYWRCINKNDNKQYIMLILDKRKMEISENGMSQLERLRQTYTDLKNEASLKDLVVLPEKLLESSSNFYFVYEFVEGINLSDYVNEKKNGIPMGELISIANNLIKTISRLSSLKISHRNINPSSIWILDKDHRIVLDYFFDAKLSVQDKGPKSLIHTYEYPPPPEMLNYTGKYDLSKIDVWGFGIVLYFITYGKIPWRDNLNINDYNQAYKRLGRLLDFPGTRNEKPITQIKELIQNCISDEAERLTCLELSNHKIKSSDNPFFHEYSASSPNITSTTGYDSTPRNMHDHLNRSLYGPGPNNLNSSDRPKSLYMAYFKILRVTAVNISQFIRFQSEDSLKDLLYFAACLCYRIFTLLLKNNQNQEDLKQTDSKLNEYKKSIEVIYLDSKKKIRNFTFPQIEQNLPRFLDDDAVITIQEVKKIGEALMWETNKQITRLIKDASKVLEAKEKVIAYLFACFTLEYKDRESYIDGDIENVLNITKDIRNNIVQLTQEYISSIE